MTAAMIAPNLEKFQQEFANYLRRQTHDAQDDQLVPKRVGALYQELIYNSVCNFPKQCFPICRALLGEDFQRLCQLFFADYALHSPYFTQINRDFVRFLEHISEEAKGEQSPALLNLPDYVPQLAHFEWMELAVDIAPDAPLQPLFSQDDVAIALNPTAQLLSYEYPVQKIHADSENINPSETFLVMYRATDNKVRTTELNALTYLLLEFMQASHVIYPNIYTLLAQFLPTVGGEMNDGLRDFVDELVQDLLNQDVLLKI